MKVRAEAEDVAAMIRTIHQAISVVSKPARFGVAKGYIRQRPLRFAFRPAAAFVWYFCVNHSPETWNSLPVSSAPRLSLAISSVNRQDRAQKGQVRESAPGAEVVPRP